jgi:hypothetical protein
MAEMVQSFVGDLMILVHTSRPPSTDEWATYISTISKLDPAKFQTLVFTDGGAPSSTQRKEVTEALGGRASRGAIVSASMLVRGVVTALSWFNPLIRAFSPDEVADALQYLCVPRDEEPRVWAEVQRLREQLGGESRSVPRSL